MFPFWLRGPIFEQVADEGTGTGAAAGEGDGTDDKGDKTKEGKEEKPPTAAELADAKKEAAAAVQRAKDAEESAQYWHKQAKGKAPAKEAKAAEPEDDTDLLEVVGKGPKAFSAWMKKAGYVSTGEVDQLVNGRAQQLTREAQLVQDYPDLKVKDSPFVKDVAAEYGRLLESGMNGTDAMERAAERVELQWLREGKRQAKGKEKDADKGDDVDDDREERKRAQQGPGGRSSSKGERDNTEMTPLQKRIADQMGISHEAYIKRAKAGVNVSR